MKCGNVRIKVQNFISVSMATQTGETSLFIIMRRTIAYLVGNSIFFQQRKTHENIGFWVRSLAALVSSDSRIVGRSFQQEKYIVSSLSVGIFFFFLFLSWNFRHQGLIEGQQSRRIEPCLPACIWQVSFCRLWLRGSARLYRLFSLSLDLLASSRDDKNAVENCAWILNRMWGSPVLFLFFSLSVETGQSRDCNTEKFHVKKREGQTLFWT